MIIIGIVERCKLLTIDFAEPIDFTVNIEKISLFDGKSQEKIWIEGLIEIEKEKRKIGFFCPYDLEVILRKLNIKLKDTVRIVFLGNRYLKHINENYFVEVL